MIIGSIQSHLKILIILSVLSILTACEGGSVAKVDLTTKDGKNQIITNLADASIIMESDSVGQNISMIDLNSSLSTGETVGDTITVSTTNNTVVSTDLLSITQSNGQITIELSKDAQNYLTTNGITADSNISFQIALITSEGNIINITLTIEIVTEGVTMSSGTQAIVSGISENDIVFTMPSSVNVRNASNTYTLSDDTTQDYAQYFAINSEGVVTIKAGVANLDAIKGEIVTFDINLSSTNTTTNALFSVSASLVINVLGLSVNSETFTTIWNVLEGKNLGTVSSKNTTGNSGFYSITGGNTQGLFSIDPTSGIISTSSVSLQIIKDTQHQLEVSITARNYSAKNTITIDVKSLEVGGDSFTTVWDLISGFEIGTVSSTNTTAEAINSYRITSGNSSNLFAIDSTGKITTTGSLSSLKDNNVTLTIELQTNSYAVSGNISISIQSLEVGEDTFMTIFTINQGSTLGTISATNTTGNTASYSILSGNDQGLFALDSTTGVLTTAKASLEIAINNDVVLQIELTAGSYSATGNATVQVKNLSVGGDSFTTVWDLISGFEIGTVSSTNTTAEAINSYSITNGNSSNLFAIDSTGKITATGSLSSLKNSSVTLTIELQTNSYAVSGDISISVQSLEVGGDSFTTVWDLISGFEIGTVSSTNTTAEAINSYRITHGNPSNLFAIDSTGKITATGSLSSLKNSSVTLTIELQTNSYAVSGDISILVQSLEVGGDSFTTVWDLISGFEIGTVSSTNTTAEAINSYRITSGNSSNLFAIDSTGKITATGSLSSLKDSSVTLTIELQTNSYAVSGDISILIQSLEVGGDTFSVLSDTNQGSMLGTISATNPTKNTANYSILSGNDQGLFVLDSITGVLTTAKASLEIVTNSDVALEIGLIAGSYSATGDITIQVRTFSIKDEIIGIIKDARNNYTITTVDVKNKTGEAINSYEIIQGNQVGLFEINSTGEIKTVVTNSLVGYLGQQFELVVRVKTASYSSTGIIKINVVGNCYDNTSIITAYNSNPLVKCQWYYENDGLNTSFAGKTGNNDIDLDVHAVHTESYNSQVGILGRGIKIAIIDDGLDMTHEDLNADTQYSYNVADGSNNPSPVYGGDSHGTSVAGIINMQDNSIGGLGIAPGATVYGRNLLGNDLSGGRYNVSDQQFFYMFGLLESPNSTDFYTASSTIDIYNNSWGSIYCSAPSENTFSQTQLEASRDGRNGKGNIYVKSAGNGFNSGYCSCFTANTNNVSCQNANEDSYNSLPEIIVTGAFNAKGKPSSYSSHGANLWVSAPGGEYGIQIDRVASVATTDADISNILYKRNSPSYGPAMVTTDLTGCDKGYSYVRSGSGDYVSSSDFNYDWNPNKLDNYVIISNSKYYYSNLNTKVGPHALNSNCNYNNSMNGTSSAAPATTGIIALMLEVNPDLTNRDVKHILANTAINDIENNLVEREVITYKDSSTNYTTIIDQGWVTNAAGYRFSNAYGFGLVNAKKAVDMTKTYTANSIGNLIDTDEISSGTVNNSFDIQGTAVESTINVTNNLVVENVVVRLNVTHYQIGFVKVVLVSPSGTESIIYWPFNVYNMTDHFVSTRFLSNAFYDESGQGDWKIKISDVGSTGVTKRLDSWSIQILGH